MSGNSNELLGGGGVQPTHGDAIANQVLVKGEPVAPATGRADDFAWPRGSDAKAAVEPVAPAVRAEPAAAPVADKNVKGSKAAKGKAAQQPAKPSNAKTAQNKPAAEEKPKTAKKPPPRRASGPFGWFR